MMVIRRSQNMANQIPFDRREEIAGYVPAWREHRYEGTQGKSVRERKICDEGMSGGWLVGYQREGCWDAGRSWRRDAHGRNSKAPEAGAVHDLGVEWVFGAKLA